MDTPTFNAMRWTTVLFLLITAVAAQAQREKFVRYNLLIDRARWLASSEQHTAALAAYDSAFALIPFMGMDHFWAARTALLAGRDDRANSLLIEGAENGLRMDQRYDSTLQAFVLSERAMPFLNTRDYMEQRFLSRVDTAFIAALRSIGDGHYYHEGPDGALTMYFDTLAFERFMSLVKERGYPNVLNVGEAIYIPRELFAKQLSGYPDDPRWARVLPHIERAMNTGLLPPDYLCMFQDMADQLAGRPMRYGVTLRHYRNDEVIQMASRKEVDKARAAVGLGPIDRTLAMYGIAPEQVTFGTRASERKR